MASVLCDQSLKSPHRLARSACTAASTSNVTSTEPFPKPARLIISSPYPWQLLSHHERDRLLVVFGVGLTDNRIYPHGERRQRIRVRTQRAEHHGASLAGAQVHPIACRVHRADGCGA